MRIAIISPHIEHFADSRALPALGGALVDRGYQVDLLRTWQEWDEVRAEELGLRVMNLGTRRFVPFLPSIARISPMASYRVKMSILSIGMAPGLISYLRREKPDFLIARMMTVPTVLIRALSMSSTRLILATAGVPHHSRFRKLVWPHVYPRADGWVACAGVIADEVCSLSGVNRDSYWIIPDIVYDESIERLADEPVDHPWFQDSSTPVIVAAGRLTRQKDFPTLLRAFAILRGRRRVKLIIMGEGEDRKKLNRLIVKLGIQDDVEMPGFVTNLYKFIRAADLFVLSSLWEGVSHALVLAQALGAPIVSTDCPAGQREVLLDGAAGRLVPVGNASHMASAIGELLTDRVAAQQMVDAGLEARYRYTSDHVVAQWDKMLRELSES